MDVCMLLTHKSEKKTGKKKLKIHLTGCLADCVYLFKKTTNLHLDFFGSNQIDF